ncbi:MAG: GGDEF domain-containing protein [Actinobacteria bacterium]|nr:MAG: GGDEF domain-containing protein [Actinomycetota bacterium]
MKDTTAHEPRPRRAPRAALHLSLLAGTLVVEGITLASGNAASPYPLLYFLVATAAFCFLRPLEGALQATLILAAYSVGLVLAPPSVGSAPLRGVLFALALCAGGASIGALRARHDRLMTEFRRLSRTDPLTGLLDRDGFDVAMANEFERARRSGSRFGLIVTAIDGFDSLPTAEREFLLVAAGRTAAAAKRDVDSAARLGDDELAIIATYTDERGAGVLAERICDQARELGRVTLSAGVVSYPRHGATTEQLLGAARDAGAAAAELGGDRVLVATSAADSIAARLASADVRVVPAGS